MLSRLIYTSQSKSPLPLDLKDVLAAARKNNPPLGVTGALAFLDGVYLQYLEGELDVLTRLYRTIEADQRHSAPHLLEKCPIDKRQFADWSMGLVTWDDETRALFRKCSHSREPGVYKMDPKRSAEFFQALRRGKNWLAVEPAPRMLLKA